MTGRPGSANTSSMAVARETITTSSRRVTVSTNAYRNQKD
ncbi:hypothetical protein CRUP_037621 [Coryphaenoides rupestris]|nr:hypothetical protein CRUP_037621 [Coryphaenoides rupestris]